MKLNQILAVEKGLKARTVAQVTDLMRTLEKPALFDGMTRTYQKKDDAEEQLPAERKVVQRRVDDILGAVRLGMGELIDVVSHKETANTRARAAVVLDGETLLDPLPATVLLMLEKTLADLRTIAEKIPVLDIAENWTRDANAGLYKAASTTTSRTKKTQRAIVKYDATEHHPAQTEMITEDVTVGWWSTEKLSAAMPGPQKEQLLKRVDKLLAAVKIAREEANSIEAGERPAIGGAIFDYLFNGQERKSQAGL